MKEVASLRDTIGRIGTGGLPGAGAQIS